MAQVNVTKFEVGEGSIHVTFLCRDNATQFHESLTVSVAGLPLSEGADHVIAVAHRQLRSSLQALPQRMQSQTRQEPSPSP